MILALVLLLTHAATLLLAFAHGTNTQRRLDHDSIRTSQNHSCPVCHTDFSHHYPETEPLA